jgi:general secretion pathway protein D
VLDPGDKSLGPTTSKRSASTNVIVRDGQTAVIGGLLGDDVSVTERKIPFLGDIPILGYLFKVKTKKVQKTNLLIFVTPYIVPDSEDKNVLDSIREKKVQGAMTFLEKNKLEGSSEQEKFLKRMINLPK